MKNIIFIVILTFCFKYSTSDEIKPIVIEQNCQSCHGKNYSGNKYIKSIKDLDRKKFVEKMKNYKKKNDNSVMSRIVKVLSVNDIEKIAEIIYE
ncbi:MAG: hypothetical protein CMP38_02280 [Rickettsiales bacterium]|nr:hypothetical protein [Rickettsiales bacterium]|tara:strand:- start:979 stop:1260 length:282 start_codon:yes stop_codon:yes gene_type:complete